MKMRRAPSPRPDVKRRVLAKVWKTLMLRSFAPAAIALLLAATAAQAEPGEPYSPERQTYCTAEHQTCVDNGNPWCAQNNNTPDCFESVQTDCQKKYDTCFTGADGAPPPSSAGLAASCRTLFSELNRHLRSSSINNYVSVLWTTNYAAHGTLYAGRSLFLVRASRREIAGDGWRYRVFHKGSGTSPENVSLRIVSGGRFLLQGQYGPYAPTCFGDRFAVLDTGDSVETFLFRIPPVGGPIPP